MLCLKCVVLTAVCTGTRSCYSSIDSLQGGTGGLWGGTGSVPELEPCYVSVLWSSAGWHWGPAGWHRGLVGGTGIVPEF